VLVAVSGGADSTALLLALVRLAPGMGLRLTAAHLHHGLRGADADADLAHVRALCADSGVPLLAARRDARAFLARERRAGEDGLRVLRRRFLRAAARRAGAAAIATAHTADDQLETVLMRLARGTGVSGLGGMRPRQGAWIKPLLAATRRDVEADLVAAGVAWREDASNRERGAFRNRLRLDVIPALAAAFAPRTADVAAARAGLARRVAAAAAETRGAAALARSLAARALARAGRPGEARIEARALRVLPSAVQAAALRLLWKQANPRSSGLAGAHLAALRRLLTARSGSTAALPGGWHARRQGALLAIAPDAAPRGTARERLAMRE
jgi:tRNA(Ile)-lysidine synthase